jgi:ribosomal protein S18 acetylase RimI-like enzyme
MSDNAHIPDSFNGNTATLQDANRALHFFMESLESKLESTTLKQKPRLQIDQVTKNNLGQVRAILRVFGIDSIVDAQKFRSKMVYFQDIPVGAVSTHQDDNVVIIDELHVLPAYHNYGCGTLLLEDVIEHYKAMEGSLLESKPTQLQVNSPEESIGWFEKKGFIKQGDILVYSLGIESE